MQSTGFQLQGSTYGQSTEILWLSRGRVFKCGGERTMTTSHRLRISTPSSPIPSSFAIYDLGFSLKERRTSRREFSQTSTYLCLLRDRLSTRLNCPQDYQRPPFSCPSPISDTSSRTWLQQLSPSPTSSISPGLPHAYPCTNMLLFLPSPQQTEHLPKPHPSPSDVPFLCSPPSKATFLKRAVYPPYLKPPLPMLSPTQSSEACILSTPPKLLKKVTEDPAWC